jgi:hypothetical protein
VLPVGNHRLCRIHAHFDRSSRWPFETTWRLPPDDLTPGSAAAQSRPGVSKPGIRLTLPGSPEPLAPILTLDTIGGFRRRSAVVSGRPGLCRPAAERLPPARRPRRGLAGPPLRHDLELRDRPGASGRRRPLRELGPQGVVLGRPRARRAGGFPLRGVGAQPRASRHPRGRERQREPGGDWRHEHSGGAGHERAGQRPRQWVSRRDRRRGAPAGGRGRCPGR